MPTSGDPEQPPIEDYGFIGDCRTAALVSRSGSIDWLCLPNFDSPSVFARLLDPVSGGYFSVQPSERSTSTRRYIDSTCVLETTFETQGGRVRVFDLMPILDDARALRPMREVLRVIEGVDGNVEMSIRLDPRPGYGRTRSRLRGGGRLGWSYCWSNELLLVHADFPLSRTDLALSVGSRFERETGATSVLPLSRTIRRSFLRLASTPTCAWNAPNRGGADGPTNAPPPIPDLPALAPTIW